MVQRKLIGEYLIEDGKITHDQLQEALETQANSMGGGRMPLIGTILVEGCGLNPRDLQAALERQERDRLGETHIHVPQDPDADQRARDIAAATGSREQAETHAEGGGPLPT